MFIYSERKVQQFIFICQKKQGLGKSWRASLTMYIKNMSVWYNIAKWVVGGDLDSDQVAIGTLILRDC